MGAVEATPYQAKGCDAGFSSVIEIARDVAPNADSMNE